MAVELVDEYAKWKNANWQVFSDVNSSPEPIPQMVQDMETWFKERSWKAEGVMLINSSGTLGAGYHLDFVFHSEKRTPTFPYSFLYTPRPWFKIWGDRYHSHIQPALDLKELFDYDNEAIPDEAKKLTGNFYHGKNKGQGVNGIISNSYYVELSPERIGPILPFGRLEESTYGLHFREVTAYPFGLYLPEDTRLIAACDPSRVRIEVLLLNSVQQWQKAIDYFHMEQVNKTSELERIKRELEALAIIKARINGLDPERFNREEQEGLVLLERLKTLPKPFSTP